MAVIHTSRLYETIVAGGVAITGVNADGVVTPTNLQGAAQSIINAFDDSDAAQLAFENTQARMTAGTILETDKSANAKIQRAIAGLTIDEINVIRSWVMAFKTEVAAATTLADLKTRVATLPNLPARTQAQAITAIKNMTNAGTVD